MGVALWLSSAALTQPARAVEARRTASSQRARAAHRWCQPSPSRALQGARGVVPESEHIAAGLRPAPRICLREFLPPRIAPCQTYPPAPPLQNWFAQFLYRAFYMLQKSIPATSRDCADSNVGSEPDQQVCEVVFSHNLTSDKCKSGALFRLTEEVGSNRCTPQLHTEKEKGPRHHCGARQQMLEANVIHSAPRSRRLAPERAARRDKFTR
jgi:hypothetical protein